MKDRSGKANKPASARYAVLVHGGTISNPDHVDDAHMELIQSIVTDARNSLAKGQSALDAVVDAIVRMEDSGLLDAGKGSFRNADGFTETDASLMDGATGKAGCVAAMQRLRNPIRAARIVMQDTPHVFFAGPTGEDVLVALGAEPVQDPQAYFVPCFDPTAQIEPTGTVGAVALDSDGRLAAGTSTGGYPGKLPGRVGDSPIIGASTFASERFALSATGRGENFIRRSVTHHIAMRSLYLGESLQEAADFVVHRLIGQVDRVSGAIIALGRDGEMAISAANAIGVLHGYASGSGDVVTAVEV